VFSTLGGLNCSGVVFVVVVVVVVVFVLLNLMMSSFIPVLTRLLQGIRFGAIESDFVKRLLNLNWQVSDKQAVRP